MSCPKCRQPITESEKYYSCGCKIKVWKTIRGKKISPDTAVQLIKNGRTSLLYGFISKDNQKPYSACLIIKDGKVGFEYPQRNSPAGRVQDIKTAWIRVQSYNSGEAQLIIKCGPLDISERINYGHVSATMAEILASITAVNIIKHKLTHISGINLDLSLNSLVASKYVLNEMKSRNKDINNAIRILFDLLKEYANWRAYYKREKRPALKGSAHTDHFPRGIFPWINVNINEENGSLLVKLPKSPDVIEQFKSSMHKARNTGEENVFILPDKARPALMAWIKSVKSE